MELIELGMDSWLANHAGELCTPEQRVARITVVDRGWYTLRNEYGEVPAQATGRFMYSRESTVDMPCVGDWVCAEYPDAEKYASLHTVLPRKSFLRRKFSGKSKKLQMIAANLDVVFIVQSCHYDFNLNRLERYLVMASEGRVAPVIVLSKTDLVSAGELEALIAEIRSAGIKARIIALSNVSEDGLEEFAQSLESGKTYCLVGSSGVGKSTLINMLTGSDALRTGKVMLSGEGRHTTVRRQLIVLKQGAMVIDTPGMREVGILDAREEVEENFDDINELSLQCRFTNCSHSHEPGCAIVVAIEAGKLNPEHYRNYVKLKAESAHTKGAAGRRGKGRIRRMQGKNGSK